MAHGQAGRATKRMAYYMIMDGSSPEETRQHRHQAGIWLLGQANKRQRRAQEEAGRARHTQLYLNMAMILTAVAVHVSQNKEKEKARRKEAVKANSKPASAGDAMAASVGQLFETLAEEAKASSAAAVAAAATAAREAASGEVMAAAYQHQANTFQQQANLAVIHSAEAWYAKWTAGKKGKRGLPLPIYCNALGLDIDELRREEE